MPRVLRDDSEVQLNKDNLECDVARFAELVRQQRAHSGELLNLLRFVITLILFCTCIVYQTAYRGEEQAVLEAIRSAVDGAVYDSTTQAKLADVATETDVMAWMSDAMLPLLMDANKEWYDSENYVTNTEFYDDAITERPVGDKLVSGYP